MTPLTKTVLFGISVAVCGVAGWLFFSTDILDQLYGRGNINAAAANALALVGPLLLPLGLPFSAGMRFSYLALLAFGNASAHIALVVVYGSGRSLTDVGVPVAAIIVSAAIGVGCWMARMSQRDREEMERLGEDP